MSILGWFKIDLIVWKLQIELENNNIVVKFKIDLIVWKLKIDNKKFLKELSLK